MAQRIANKFPLDLQARKAIGVAIPFSNKAVFTSTYTTKDQIKSNLINYFLTNKGERIMQPNFGSNLRIFVFEQLDNLVVDSIKQKIQDELSAFFPNVNVRKLDILSSPASNGLQVNLTYNVVNFGIEDEINLIFE
jgi:phage baseplate assembly protein W